MLVDCPICGEEIPLSGKTCGSCGYEEEAFFLTEEMESSTLRQYALRKAQAEQAGQDQKGRKFFKGKKKGEPGNGAEAQGHIQWK